MAPAARMRSNILTASEKLGTIGPLDCLYPSAEFALRSRQLTARPNPGEFPDVSSSNFEVPKIRTHLS